MHVYIIYNVIHICHSVCKMLHAHLTMHIIALTIIPHLIVAVSCDPCLMQSKSVGSSSASNDPEAELLFCRLLQMTYLDVKV